MPNYTLVLDRGDGSEPQNVPEYESVIGMFPGLEFAYEGRLWLIDRVSGDGLTLHCKAVDPE
jgi:hypothetical protein